MKSLQQLTYVSDSDIHGQGLFARAKIHGDTVIGKLKGRHCKRDGDYVLWLSETQGFKVSCNLKYINHANTPNACYYDDLRVVALRDIKQDEEITHDYESSEW